MLRSFKNVLTFDLSSIFSGALTEDEGSKHSAVSETIGPIVLPNGPLPICQHQSITLWRSQQSAVMPEKCILEEEHGNIEADMALQSCFNLRPSFEQLKALHI